ncbi:signal peptidase I [Puniceicoccaceae bacterium K14]|nr:signal peptidase I [Puniceicoccaceae bacterium K14]
MFSFLQSEKSKLRQGAKQWLYLGKKVYNFRKDELNDSELSELSSSIEQLKVQLSSKGSDNSKMKAAIDKMESIMREVGGSFFPRTSMGENVDFFFMALIIYLGFTAFFVKPFKIPTNSMWPTYHGMTAEVWTDDEETPSAPARLARLAAFGAVRYEFRAPADGEFTIPVYREAGNGLSRRPEVVTKRKYFVIPGKGWRHTFAVGGEVGSVTVPLDFQLDSQVLLPAFFPDAPDLNSALNGLSVVDRRFEQVRGQDGSTRNIEAVYFGTGRTYKKGDLVFAFDILTGDQLFVDRMSYHFVSPKTGDGFVFRTGNIPRLKGEGDKFYIKRLAGLPGDVLQIEEGGLIVNGKPAEGSIAFDLNATQADPYRGYVNSGNLASGRTLEIPEDSYYALGDNSNNSKDGRNWGFVPEGDVIGKPFLIYYPFTSRFGLAK